MTRAGRRRLILAGALALAACGSGTNQSDAGTNAGRVGHPCDLGVSIDGSAPPRLAAITHPVLECASELCLFGPIEKASTVGALCTALCTTDFECTIAESGDASDPDDHRCKTGFACMMPTTVGLFACQKMCVCMDSLNVPVGGFQTPAVCL